MGKPQLMIKLLQDLVFQIENKSQDPKFTDFMEKAINGMIELIQWQKLIQMHQF